MIVSENITKYMAVSMGDRIPLKSMDLDAAIEEVENFDIEEVEHQTWDIEDMDTGFDAAYMIDVRAY